MAAPPLMPGLEYTYDGGAAPAMFAPSLSALNTDCTRCSKLLDPINSAVTLLVCGHGVHAGCQQMFAHLPDAVQPCGASVCTGPQRPPPVSPDSTDSLSAKFNTERRTEDAEDWRNTYIDEAAEAYAAEHVENRLKFFTKVRLLAPYNIRNPIQVRKMDVTVQTLLDLESDRLEGDATEVDLADPDVQQRVSIDRFLAAGMTFHDIYFGLDVKSWPMACSIGLRPGHVGGDSDPVPLRAVSALYRVDYSELLKIGWSMAHIHASESLTARDLGAVGLDFESLIENVGMRRADFVDLRIGPDKWQKELGLKKGHLTAALRLDGAMMHDMDWNPRQVTEVFALSPAEQHIIGIIGTETRRRTTTTSGLFGGFHSSSSSSSSSSEEAEAPKAKRSHTRRTKSRRRTKASKGRRHTPVPSCATPFIELPDDL